MIDAKEFLSRLDKVKRTPGGWVACCPVPEHGNGTGDKNPSLGIYLRDGRLYVHCFAGCQWQRVFAVLGYREDGDTIHYIRDSVPAAHIVHETHVDWMKGVQAACESMNERRARRLADRLAVGVDSLDLLRVGWSQKKLAYTFPMVGPDNSWTGVQLRSLGGKKWCVTGSRGGLFAPKRMSGTGYLLICEGASDTLAALSLGYDAIGRFSAQQDWLVISDYFDIHHIRRDVAIIADRDTVGSEAAKRIAPILSKLSKSVRIVTPLKAKDLREWAGSGLKRTTLDALIRSKTPV